MSPPPRGLISEVLTPLKDPGRAVALDPGGLANLLGATLPHAQGILLAGPILGQGPLLSQTLWPHTVEAGLALVPGDTPLLVGLTAATSAATLKRARWLGRRLAGRPAWGLDLALYHHSNRGLPAHVAEMAQALGGPVLLANQPELVKGRGKAAKRANIMASVLAKCAVGGALAGLVYAGPFRQGVSLQRALRRGPGQSEAAFYDYDETAFLARPASWGLVSQGSGLIPAQWQLLAGQSRQDGQPEPRVRRQLISAATRAESLARVMAPAPAAIAAYLAHRQGLIASARTLADQARTAQLAAAETWAAEAWPG